jgi:hypothetical protein
MGKNTREQKNRITRPKKPFFFSLLCYIGFSYTMLFSIMFLAGMIYSSGISGIFDKYLQIYDLSGLNFFLFSMLGFVIFFGSFTGILLMWKLYWPGFYIYTVSALMFMTLEIFYAGFYLPDILIHVILILLFFLSFPHKMRKKNKLPENTGTTMDLL